MKDIVLLGPQGSGKGTQAKLILKEHTFEFFEMGAQCRKTATEDSERGREVKQRIEAGNLVPLFIIEEIFGDFVKYAHPDTPILFDGIPRDIAQKEVFDKVMKENNREFQVLEINIPYEESMDRLLKRAQIEGRADDKVDAIKRRLDIYHDNTMPVLESYAEDGIRIKINGHQSIEDVAAEVKEKLAL